MLFTCEISGFRRGVFEVFGLPGIQAPLFQKCNMIKDNLCSLNEESTKMLHQQSLLQKLGENPPEFAETLYEHI